MICQTFHRETSFQIGREQLEKCAMVSIAQMIELTLTVAVGRSHLRTQLFKPTTAINRRVVVNHAIARIDQFVEHQGMRSNVVGSPTGYGKHTTDSIGRIRVLVEKRNIGRASEHHSRIER